MVNVGQSPQQQMKHRIEECALQYKQNLLNRYVLFGPTDGTAPYETFFPQECFFHLCGIEYKNPRQRVSTKKFFDLAIEKRIDPDLFAPKYSRFTVRKLEVLPKIVRIDGYAAKFARMPLVHFGKTQADFIVFNGDTILGFRAERQQPHHLVPTTVLVDNIQKLGDEKNVGFVLKSEPFQASYSYRTKPKGEITDQRHSMIKRSLSRYAGSCTPPLGWDNSASTSFNIGNYKTRRAG